jgi:hypothetical protein
MKTLKDGENPMLMDQQNQYCGNGYTIKSKLNVQ